VIEVIGPAADALEILGCVRALAELQQSAVLFQKRRADLGRCREEELSAFVNEVDSAVGELPDLPLNGQAAAIWISPALGIDAPPPNITPPRSPLIRIVPAPGLSGSFSSS